MTGFSFRFFFNSVFLGVGLAMDAFSVSLANGLREPKMRNRKMCVIAGVFAGFQALMPMVGWILVHTVLVYFQAFEWFIPWIALGLLSYIGGKMIYEGMTCGESEESCGKLTLSTLLLQGVATSIDALSVGFTISEYDWKMALCCAMIIAAVTFVICLFGLAIGKRFGMRLSNRAQILGGVILLVIGLEIFVSGVLL